MALSRESEDLSVEDAAKIVTYADEIGLSISETQALVDITGDQHLS